jgi:hypothetical protein
MQSAQFIKKIRFFTLISFLLPLLTINSCLIIYKFLGDFDTYAPFKWETKKQVYTPSQYTSIQQNIDGWSFTNCSKYKTIDINVYENQNKDIIKHYVKEKTNSKDARCVKNSKIIYFLLDNFKFLEKILVDAKISFEKEGKGFSKVRNPYLYGEVSISRTARYFPATFIFKPLIILSSILLLFYWKNNLNLFREFKKQKILLNFSETFFYIGILSCLFLILHATFLGLDIESKLFAKVRKVIIVLFIIFELLAQIFLTINLYRLKKSISKYINSKILQIKIIFIYITIGITLIILGFLIWGDVSSDIKNIFEWNYFSFLLIYYFLSRLLWKP